MLQETPPLPKLDLGRRRVGDDEPTYFVADISANHDGDLERARRLINFAAIAGADAAKFQNFRAPKIVSHRGFQALGAQLSHQARWRKSVFQVYQEAALPWEWTGALKAECDRAGIDYFSAPYDLEAVDMLDPFVAMFKIGSGDLNWPEMLRKVASKGKPVLLATGAADISEVQRAVGLIQALNPKLVLMQCNTNYTGSAENFRHIHLNVLKTYRVMFPEVVLGLSDHTPGHVTVLGAVALGAKVVEKHFTDDNTRQGPDHAFSMTPAAWREMVARTRELEQALGEDTKRVAANEAETQVIQRRCLRAAWDLAGGTVLSREMIELLRPAPQGALCPEELPRLLGMRLRQSLSQGEHFEWAQVEEVPRE